MSKNREDLDNLLVDILGSSNVYFQPPESLKLKYPCIRYSLDNMESSKADNFKYLKYKRYMVTFIHKDPESDIVDKLYELEHCSYNRHYIADNLYHDVFNLYY